MKRVLIVAAEASSELFATRLLEHWKRQHVEFDAFGVGSRSMEALGFRCVGRSEEMAVMGFVEALKHYRHLKSVFNSLVREAQQAKPDLVLLLDYPGFNLRLARVMKEMGIPVVYYVAPQVWAWKRNRVHQIKRWCDKVLVLFDFEKKFFDLHGVPNQFVGHPLLDELGDELFDLEKCRLARSRRGVSENEIVLGLMPGSRRGEIERHLDLQLQVAGRLTRKVPNLKVMVLMAPGVSKEQLQEKIAQVSFSVTLVQDQPASMIALTDVVLVASGTATLLVGLLRKPMVIMYKFNAVTALLARLLVRGVRFFGLPNLIMGEEVVPERWQGQANPDELERLLMALISDPGSYQQTQGKLALLHERLGQKGATLRVAEALKEWI